MWKRTDIGHLFSANLILPSVSRIRHSKIIQHCARRKANNKAVLENVNQGQYIILLGLWFAYKVSVKNQLVPSSVKNSTIKGGVWIILSLKDEVGDMLQYSYRQQ